MFMPASYESATVIRCNCNCPREFQPVCAQDSTGDREMFPNECHLNCYNCTHDKGNNYPALEDLCAVFRLMPNVSLHIYSGQNKCTSHIIFNCRDI